MNTSSPFSDPSVMQAAASSASATPASSNTPLPNPFGSSASSAPTPSSHVPSGEISSQYQPNSAPNEAYRHDQNLVEEFGSSIKGTDSSTILKVMRILNVVLACLTIATGILSWVLGFANDFQRFIASIYVVVFGLLLLAFELRTGRLEATIEKNFGFMYGYKTRTTFLVFIAIWPLSLGNHWITILDAVLLFLNAFFNLFVIYNHPAFSSTSNAPAYQPPKTTSHAPDVNV